MPKGAYCIHLSLDSFIAAVQVSDVGDEPIYVQETSKPDYVQNIPAGLMSIITCTAADVAGTIHAVRIPVERVLTLGDAGAVQRAVSARLQQAIGLVKAALPGDDFRAGVLLVPGLLDDLQKFEGSQELWTWENARDPIERTLVPRT